MLNIGILATFEALALGLYHMAGRQPRGTRAMPKALRKMGCSSKDRLTRREVVGGAGLSAIAFAGRAAAIEVFGQWR
jgi:hypothetical protein